VAAESAVDYHCNAANRSSLCRYSCGHPTPFPLDFVPGFVPTSSLELFTHWDGAWFKQIVTQGYNYVADGKMHNIAFFPVFPLVVRAVMSLGFSFEIAGLLVNNLALLVP
jgi:hypothetical protein